MLRRFLMMLFYSSLALVALGALLWAGIRVIEPRSVFPAPLVPQEQLDQAAAAQGARVVRLVTPDGHTLYGWRLGEGPRLALIFTGNAASVGQKPERYKRFLDLGFEVLHVNYRGYPGSTGTPSEEGLKMDAAEIWTEALRTHPPSAIGIYAKSLGGGVAVSLVSGLRPEAQPGALILDSTFTALIDVAARQHPFLPVRWFLRTRFDSLSVAPNIACPTLILHGREDVLIPVEDGHKLQLAIRGARIHTVPGQGHDDDLLADPESWQSASELFLREVRPSTRADQPTPRNTP